MASILKPSEGCYLCGREPESREHVPAKGFFPNKTSYRKQLITVPSCDRHNQDTSADDEYVRNVITAHRGNNSVAFRQFTQKVVKSLRLDISKFGKPRKIQTPQGTVHAFEIDRAILDRVLRKMGYALFFHDFKYQWNRELIILSKHLVYADLSHDDYGRLLESVEKQLPELPSNGENPQVFKYASMKTGERAEDTIFRLTFYEGFTVWITTVTDSSTWKL